MKFEYFPKICREKNSLNQTRITGTLHEEQNTFLSISRLNLRVRNVSDKTVETIETHILCSISIFFENCAVYKNCGKYCRTGQTLHAECLSKKHRVSDTYCFCTATMVIRTLLYVMLYVIAYIVFSLSLLQAR
jgi:hypothetical protein